MRLVAMLLLNTAPPFTPRFWVWRHLQARRRLLLPLSQKYLDSFSKFCIYNFLERLLKTAYLLSFVSLCPTGISFFVSWSALQFSLAKPFFSCYSSEIAPPQTQTIRIFHALDTITPNGFMIDSGMGKFVGIIVREKQFTSLLSWKI